MPRSDTSGLETGEQEEMEKFKKYGQDKISDFGNHVVAGGNQRRLDETLRFILAIKSIHIMMPLTNTGNTEGNGFRFQHIHYSVKSYRRKDLINSVFNKYVLDIWFVPHTFRHWTS